MTHFGNRLRQILDDRFMTLQDLADKLNVDRSTVSYYLTCEKPPKPFPSILEALDLSREEFFGKERKATRIPVYGTIAAGIPMEAITDISDYEDADPDVYQNAAEYFCLRLKGVSMLPRMRSGDIVIFHKQETANSGDIVAVFVGNEDATCKQLLINDDGIVLHPLNESFGDMRFTNRQVIELPITIIGKAVELRAKL